jgi:predicted transposase YbfD/YdcC
MENVAGFFRLVPDPRATNVRHDLTEILFIALASVLCGAKSCAGMALFGRLREKMLREILVLKHGVPSHDTFSFVFRRLEPKAFEQAFQKFMAAFVEAVGGEKVIAIDGKILKRAFEKGRRHAPQVMVTAWGSEMRMVLACQGTPEGHEAQAALDLLSLVDIKGVIVTADALHCHRSMAARIKERQGDYALTLKGNRSGLLRDAEELVALSDTCTFAETKEHAHGRREERRAVVVPAQNLAQKHDFPGLCAIGKITSLREKDGKTETATHFYVLSRPLTPTQLLRVVRAHWGIENQQHRVLDVVFDEDLARNRRNHAARNLAVLRRLALNILRADPSKMPVTHKIRHADWDNAFLFNLLGHMP